MPEAGEDEVFGAAEQLAAIGQAVITTDVEGVIRYWNAAAEELYGWSAGEVIGRRIDHVTIPDIAQEVGGDIMVALRDGVPWSGSFPVRRKDGTVFSALVTDSGIYRDGVLVGIIGVSTNLGSALRPLLERSTDAALILRSDAIVTYTSPAVSQLFGWHEDEVVGRSIVPLLHVEDRGRLATYLDEVVARPGPHPPLELRVQDGTGWVWAEAALTNLLDDPEVRGVVCNLRRSARRAALEEAEDRAAQLDAALRSRVVIEQAKGHLAATAGVSPDDAFELLRGHARRNQLSLHDVARGLLEGTLLLPR